MMLWPKEDVPGNTFDLSVRLQEASTRIATRKSSVAREGARQAWATLKAHFPALNLASIAVSNPKRPDETEIPPDNYFAKVLPFAN